MTGRKAPKREKKIKSLPARNAEASARNSRTSRS
jgi:hypothetical protein